MADHPAGDMPRHFTVSQARALLPEVRSCAEQIITLRADLAVAQIELQRRRPPPGGLAEMKSAEAHLQEALDWFHEHGIQVKGIAPLIIDFPSTVGGEPALLCWLEGESELAWYHAAELGFMGRRRLEV